MLRHLFLSIILTLSSFIYGTDLTPEMKDLVAEEVEARWQKIINSDEFDARVTESILNFIKEQNQARGQQEVLQRAVQNINPVDPSNDYIYGKQEAEFSLVEYSDYECPFCKKFHKTAKQFISNNEDVNWIYRHFPLDFHNPGAQKQAEAAECAGVQTGNEGFWSYTDAIFKRTRSNGNGFPIENLVPLANELGLDVKEFKSCLESEATKTKVLNQYANGQAAGVTGTPGNFLIHNATGNLMVINGAQRLSSLEQALEELKTKVRN